MDPGAMEARLREAILTAGLCLHYQPVVDLSNGSMVGVEALARWQDAELGAVPPDEFIPLAESTGLIVELGRWVLERACRQAAAWSDDLVVSVNVSPVQLRDPMFVDDVKIALGDSGLAPERLCLEVTETAIVTDVADAAAVLRRVCDLGVQFALDDFGTGHSSLTLLRNLPLQTVKIDRSLIRRVASRGPGRRARAAGDRRRAHARAAGLRRGHRGARPGPAAGVHGLRHRPGLALRPAGPRPRDGVAAGRGRLAAPGVVHAGPGGALRQRGPGGGDRPGPSRHLRVRRPAGGCSAGCRRRWSAARSASSSATATTRDRRPCASRHKDGTTRWLRGIVQPMHDVSGDVREILCVLSDVTATVDREKALADSEELFRSAFSGAPIGIALSDYDGRLLRVNPALAELLGRSVSELLRMNVADITHPDDLPQRRPEPRRGPHRPGQPAPGGQALRARRRRHAPRRGVRRERAHRGGRAVLRRGARARRRRRTCPRAGVVGLVRSPGTAAGRAARSVTRRARSRPTPAPGPAPRGAAGR